MRMRMRAAALLALASVLLSSCSYRRDVRVANFCGLPVGLAFHGGTVPPAEWTSNTTISAGKETVLEYALAGRNGDVGLVRIEYPGGSARILQIGAAREDPVVLALEGTLCSAGINA